MQNARQCSVECRSMDGSGGGGEMKNVTRGHGLQYVTIQYEPALQFNTIQYEPQ